MYDVHVTYMYTSPCSLYIMDMNSILTYFPTKLHNSVGRALLRITAVRGSNPVEASEFSLGFLYNPYENF